MPDQSITIEDGINLRTLTNTTGMIHSTEPYSGEHQLVVASSLSTATNAKIEIRVTNTSPSPFALKKKTNVAEFTILSPQEAKQLHPLNSVAFKVLAEDTTEQALEYVNKLLKFSKNLRPFTGFGSPRQIIRETHQSTLPSRAESSGKQRNYKPTRSITHTTALKTKNLLSQLIANGRSHNSATKTRQT